MQNYIEYTTLDTILFSLKDYISTGNRRYIEDIQEELKLAKEIDYSIKTKAEYATKKDFIESSHGPNRLAMFLLSYFGEFYLADGLLTIEDDDRGLGYALHTNTYQLKLKDPETHKRLYKGNPKKEDEPYDFNTRFVKQVTHFTNKSTDTTGNPWDSYQNAYTEPFRKVDFKGAFWKSGDEHFVHYTLQLQKSGDLDCCQVGTKTVKEIKFVPAQGATNYRERYFEVLALIDFFNKY